jgi:hypothetical protein
MTPATGKTWLARAGTVLVALTVAGTLAFGATPANASAQTNSASVAVFRASYQSYYDCDIAGFTGVYYGYWSGYFCNKDIPSGYWLLYA